MASTVLVLLTLLTGKWAYDIEPGPLFIATKGEVWPKPQIQEKQTSYFVLRPNVFKFNVTGTNCDALEKALSRYWKIIDKESTHLFEILGSDDAKLYKTHKPWKFTDNYIGYLDTLNVQLNGICNDTEYPYFDMDEEYILNVTSTSKLLTANSYWGILRGLETFSQLVHISEDLYSLAINATTIHDYPRFNHRGLLLDTSRHFMPLYVIFQTLDAMSYNKLNVFHWHITDDQSFPYRSVKFPQLSEKGAYHPRLKVYEQTDIQRVIKYARDRGIRVLVEFDTPGHTRSWGEGVNNLLTACYNGSEPNGKFGPIDPSNNSTYDFLEDFFEEIVNVFPDQYLHLGGDEVDFDCWQSNPNITTFMDKLNITGNYSQLESYYIQRLINMVDKLKMNSIVWEEVFNNGVQLPNRTIVHVWKDNPQSTLAAVTGAGKPALLSSCWYLDHLATGGDWRKFYECDPYDFSGDDTQKDLILGGEACMWAESVNENNVISRVWPRASAAAEKLWSSITNRTDTNPSIQQLYNAAIRLEEHACRMNRRGIAAQPPNGPGFCL